MIRSARRGRQGQKNSSSSRQQKNIPEIDCNQSERVKTANPKKGKATIQASEGLTDERDDIYDYQENTRIKGGRISGNQVDDDRLTGSSNRRRAAGSDADEEQEEQEIRDLITRCQQEDDDGFGVVASDDDESIDSDEAMGEVEEQELEIKRSDKKTKTKSVRFHSERRAKVSEQEEDEEDLESDGSDLIDASTMLDLGAETDEDFSDDEIDEKLSKSDSSSDDDSDDYDLDLDEIDSDDPAKLERLAQIVEDLNKSGSQKRKTGSEVLDANDPDSQSKRRKLLSVRDESLPESEVVARRTIGELSASSGRVHLEDLLSNLPSQHDLPELKKTLKPLSSTTSKAKSGPIPAPLEPRKQQQVERQAAYELTKKEMEKWEETTQAARGLSGKSADGKHRFVATALQKLDPADRNPDANRWNIHFKPTNDLENQVMDLLIDSQLSSKKIHEEEVDLLEAKGLTIEQIKAKAAELKMTRELMFRAERKAKRVAKIKSKAFRRIRKKEKERKALTEGESDLGFMKELDKIDGGDRVREETERMELQRARERASLKHSSQGAWAKKVSVLKGLGADANTAIQERIRREELLTKKIAGEADDGQSLSEGEDSEFDSDLDEDAIKAHALKQLSALDTEDQPGVEHPKGLMAMKFMQRAVEAKARKVQEEEEQLRKELMETEACDSENEQPESGGMKVQGNPGRLVFGPDKCRKVDQALGSEALPVAEKNPAAIGRAPTTQTSGPSLKVLAVDSRQPNSQHNSTESTLKLSGIPDESNPWLTLDGESGGTISRIENLKNTGSSSRAKDSAMITAEKAKRKAEKRKKKHTSAVTAAEEEAQVDIRIDTFLGDQINEGSGIKALESMESKESVGIEGDAMIRRGMRDSQGRTVFQQRELVSEAFADDGVVAQFEQEKQREIEEDAPKTLDVTIPGWGDWAGKGAKKSRHAKKFIKKIPGIERSERADANLSNVIISEKKNLKKVTKYQTKSLPFPYTSRSQHEHKMRQPLGPEFTTRIQHRHLVRPDVLTSPGLVIEPVSKPI